MARVRISVMGTLDPVGLQSFLHAAVVLSSLRNSPSCFRLFKTSVIYLE